MNSPLPFGARARTAKRAFTLVELMVSMAIFSMVIGGVVYAHITGLKMYELTKAKLGANDETRTAVGLLSAEVRAAKSISIGQLSNSVFVAVPEGSRQQGSALQIRQTTNTTNYVVYYLDLNDSMLKRYTDSSKPTVVAEHLTNSVVFTSEDYAGNILTQTANNRVIGITLQFYQIQYPIVKIGEGQLYDFYQLRTRITRRALE